ncbi:MAG: ATP synthase F0 subunit C [Syntrophomonadaceae bacterium]|jgi:F-type H+-transporting ATPase subunit c|nr:ATP synthase F0 subunit C [Syntrophomonadaceae bacterium]
MGGTVAIGAAMSVAISGFGGSLGMGSLGGKAMESIARQPEVAEQVRTLLFITLAFIETLTIYGLLIAFMLVGKI